MIPQLNFGTFSCCQLPQEAERTFLQYAGYNSINMNEYPEVTEMEHRLGKQFLKDQGWDSEQGYACSTTGSTEASLLAVQNALYKWKRRGGRGTPRVLMNINNHHCWDRVCRHLGCEPLYFEAELDMEVGLLTPDVDKLNYTLQLLSDEIILFVTCDWYTVLGAKDNLAGVSIPSHIPVHLDAAISGFLGTDTPADSRISSMNISNHKFGMSFPGCAWILFKDKHIVEDEMWTHTSYLAGNFKSMGFTFTKSAGHIMSQGVVHFDMKSYRQGEVRKLEKLAESLAEETLAWAVRGPIVYWIDIDESIPAELLKSGISIPRSKFRLAGEDIYVTRAVLGLGKQKKHVRYLIDHLRELR